MDGPRFGEGSAVFKVELTRPGRFSAGRAGGRAGFKGGGFGAGSFSRPELFKKRLKSEGAAVYLNLPV